MLPDPADPRVNPALERIAQLLRLRTGFEVGLYKQGTFQRRLKRRLAATACADLDAYAGYLDRHAGELSRLMREMLISVTTFFRDGPAFKTLHRALPALVASRAEGAELRLWVAGCASGEEAYSIAILALETMRLAGRDLALRVFATDLDAEAVARARRGVYPRESLDTVPAEWRERYLSEGDKGCRINKALRDCLVFSVHNLIGDAPFPRLDLISCRNVLIYLQPELQRRLLESFAQVLNPGGLLFLGRAESVRLNGLPFEVVGERAGLHRRTGAAQAPRAPRALPRPAGVRRPAPAPARDALPARLLRAIAGRLLPPSVLVDETLNIVHVLGEISPFVKLADGAMSADLLRLTIRPLRIETRALVNRMLHEPVDFLQQVVRSHELQGPVRLSVLRVEGEEGRANGLLVSFEVLPAAAGVEGQVRRILDAPAGAAGTAEFAALEAQIGASRQHLYAVIEALEGANGNLQTLNDDLQMSNEELQSANEVMETSGEELQSTNEQLASANEELEQRVRELASANAALRSDFTERVGREARLRDHLERERLAFAFAEMGIFEWHLRSGRLECSDIMLRLLGLPANSGSLRFAGFVERMHEDDRAAFQDAMKYCIAGHSDFNMEYRVHWPDGTLHWLHSRGDLVPESDAPSRVLCLTQDITERREAEAQARFIAHHDPLTGLPNRALLNDRLQQAMSTARRERLKVAVAFIDLDRFKEINDSLGHQVGDALLKAVSTRLTERVRATDTVCRLSGDEFILVLSGVHDAGEVGRILGKMHESLAQPFRCDGQELHVTASMGIAMFPEDGESIDVLVRNADAAMYHAKGRGRNAYQFFSQEMNRALVERLDIANALRSGVRAGQLELHYQSVVECRTRRLLGIEALVRWRRPGRGLVGPDVFIPVAEDSDLIHEVGEWVLQEACRQNRLWRDAGLARVRIAVNVSPAQFRHRNLIEKVAAALRESGLPPAGLELELTERVLTHSADLAAEMLNLFHQMGVTLAIDDFGTGYSSLTYLHRFPIDKLKIDRSFVSAAPGDTTAAMIVRAVTNLGRGLGLEVVAEGVESPAQLEFLRAEACHAAQGYLFSRPLPAAEFTELLVQQRAQEQATGSG